MQAQKTLTQTQSAAVSIVSNFTAALLNGYCPIAVCIRNWMSLILGAVILCLAHRFDKMHSEIIHALETTEEAGRRRASQRKDYGDISLLMLKQSLCHHVCCTGS